MKALIMKEYMKLEYTDVEMPKIKDNEVLVKIMAVSVCGSDIHGIDGKSNRRQVPIIMGHEASGMITEAGAKVTEFKPGDRVTFDSTIYCGRCEFCRKGQLNLCDYRKVYGVSCDDYRQHGAYCEYLAVPEHILYKIGDHVSYQEAALVEPMSVALHAINLLNLTSSDTVVIFGTGTIALFAVQFFKLRNCGNLIVVGRNDKKLLLAQKLGADSVINLKKVNVSTAIMELTGGQGTDYGYDAAGAQSTFHMGIASLKKGGTLVTLANLDKKFELDIASVITKQLTIKGSCASSGEYKEILDLLEKGLLKTNYVISKQLPLSEAADFIIKLHNKEITDFNKLILVTDPK
ncbi:zinc-dependent alcohol dehydrogenase [Sinanaerobacter chloroacetimidivorans]|uniref:Galactitol-1-phosphate 5-dehydrogenase n=1 Tax=Sinanaerobacter chloroacetimidivorans TaxID=2818044 RepID=A0A8J7W2C0_9FIRM|nr:galactitol-1-phosphate 5-dehydrogenase [Sinanaerobacter chloroacetimidivorans]MBR0597873.1 galactitol-1-phosphate 5-dehydrogenase [Sinanaerobacter chloroacetimidivorans]